MNDSESFSIYFDRMQTSVNQLRVNVEELQDVKAIKKSWGLWLKDLSTFLQQLKKGNVNHDVGAVAGFIVLAWAKNGSKVHPSNTEQALQRQSLNQAKEAIKVAEVV